MTTIPVSDLSERIRKFVRAYSRKRSVHIENTRTTVFLNCNYWSEGSITYYKVMHPDGVVENLTGKHPFSPGGQESYELHDGDVVLSYGIFCGKPSTPTIYVKGDRP